MTLLINVPQALTPVQREAIGLEVINFIIERTKNGLDINNNPFADYKQSYKDTFEYKVGHGGDSTVNLTLTGEMLGTISIINHGTGFIKLGFTDSEAAKKAKWIQTPSGQKAGKQSPRRFFGISQKDLNKIVARNQSDETAFQTNATRSLSQDLVRRILGF
jgi:hypothetical protein